MTCTTSPADFVSMKVSALRQALLARCISTFRSLDLTTKGAVRCSLCHVVTHRGVAGHQTCSLHARSLVSYRLHVSKRQIRGSRNLDGCVVQALLTFRTCSVADFLACRLRRLSWLSWLLLQPSPPSRCDFQCPSRVDVLTVDVWLSADGVVAHSSIAE